MDAVTPENIEAVQKAVIAIIAAIGALVATIASAVNAYYTAKNRRDIHVAHDRIRAINGEPLQYRDNPEKRELARLDAWLDEGGKRGKN